jgi:hypothetical protein
VFVFDLLLGVQKIVVVLPVQIMLKWYRDHPHLLQLIVALQMRNCALRILQEVVLDAVVDFRESLAFLEELLDQPIRTLFS